MKKPEVEMNSNTYFFEVFFSRAFHMMIAEHTFSQANFLRFESFSVKKAPKNFWSFACTLNFNETQSLYQFKYYF